MKFYGCLTCGNEDAQDCGSECFDDARERYIAEMDFDVEQSDEDAALAIDLMMADYPFIWEGNAL